jgi:outer membrane protein assembly factor BamB
METILPGACERTRAAHPARIVTGLVPRAPRPRLRLGVLVAALVTATAFNVGPTAAAASTAARHVGGAVAVHAGSSLSLTGFAPASGPVGTKVTLSGTGFTSSDVVAFNGTNASTQHVNKAGTQLVTQVPPLSTSGPITVTDPATGQTAGLPGTAFQVTTGIAAFPGQVWPGERFTFAGSALTPNSGETLMLDSTVLGDARTDSHGNVATPFTLPGHTKPGQHTISLVDATYGALKNALPVLSSWPQIGAVPARTFNNTGEWLLPPSKLASVSKKLGIAFVGLIRSSAIVAGGLMYIPYGSKLTAENALTGVPAWTFTAGDDINTTPAVDSGLIYFGSLDGSMYVLDALTGVYKWRTTLGNSYSSPLVNKGVLYFGTDTGFLYALNATTGGFLWDYQTGGVIASPPSIAKGILYFGSDDDYIYALKASTGQFIWRFKTCIDPNNPTCFPDELPVSVAGGVAVEPS